MAGQVDRASKRRRLDNEPQHPDGDIRGAFELHNLLQFRQSAEPDVKAGIDRARKFLVDIAANKDPAEKAVLLKVLKQYCDDQSSSSKNEVDFPDLLSTWSFAVQNDADSITSAVPAVLAQFFRTINNELDFRDFGLSLCHSLLKSDQVRLLDRGLSAQKHKDFMISPCLRLLTEITIFDAGALAPSVFSRRDILLRRLEILLEPPPRHREESDRRRPTVRRNSQRLLLALMRYLDGEAKAELVTQGKVLCACVRNLSIDGGDVVRDVLKTMGLSLLGPGLSKAHKSRFLNAANLQLFAQLYDFEAEEVDQQSDAPSVRQTTHEFLVHACASINGVLVAQNGWYPANFESKNYLEDDDDSGIDLGLDSPYYSDDYSANVPVKNTNISIFLQKLKPASDVLQAELVLKIFGAAPELVADYFCKRPKALGSPSNDNSWLGEFGFLYSVVDLHVPRGLGHGERTAIAPPPLSIVVENILPRALDRSSSTAYLKNNEDITIISASRLLTVALQKLHSIITTFRSPQKHRQLWDQASTKLLNLVSARAPLYQELVAALQKAPKENLTVRSALLECMAMYKKVLPLATVSSSFDVSPLLLDVLRQLNSDDLDDNIQQALDQQKASFVIIASLSRGTKWWHKSASEELSPIVALLVDVATHSPSGEGNQGVIGVLRGILQEKGIVHQAQEGWSALRESLRGALSVCKPYDQTLLSALENCMTRTMKQPVKYVDYLEDIRGPAQNSKPLSLLACSIAEQWPHLLKYEDLKATSDFVSKFFSLLEAGGEDGATLELLRVRMLQDTKDHKKHRKVLKKAFESQASQPITFDVDSSAPSGPTAEAEQIPQSNHLDTADLFPSPPPLPTIHRPFPPTYSLESDLSIPSSSRLGIQIRLLSSPVPELRLGALSTLAALLPTLPTSTYSEATQIHLLIGELLETARQHAIDASTSPTTKPTPSPALPSLITALALILLTILTDPSDPMYSKANRFLLLSPTWLPLPRILPYWTTQIIFSEPETDTAPSSTTVTPDLETLRYLSILSDGLLTPQDAELCRRAGIWERLGSLYLRPGCRREVRQGVLRCLWNAAGVQGGADTLITRGGVRAWLGVVEGRERGEMREMVRAVRRRIEEKCDWGYIGEWEGGLPRKGAMRAGGVRVEGEAGGEDGVAVGLGIVE